MEINKEAASATPIVEDNILKDLHKQLKIKCENNEDCTQVVQELIDYCCQ